MMCVELGRLSGPLTKEVACEALFWCQNRYPMLHARIHKTAKGGYAWQIERDFAGSNSLDVVPLAWLARADDSQAYRQADQELQTPLPDDGFLWRVTILSDGDNHDILITLDHSITDAISFVMLFDRFLKNCQLIIDGQSDRIPKETEPFPDALENLVPTSENAQMLGSAPIGDHQPWVWQEYAPIDKRKPGNIWFQADEADAQKLVRASKSAGVTVNSALGAAILLATADVIYGDGESRVVPFSSASSLRGFCDPPLGDEAFGYFITVLSTLESIGPERSFWDVAKSIGTNLKQVQNEKERDGFFPSTFDCNVLEESVPAMIDMLDQAKVFPVGIGISNIGVVDVEPAYGPFVVQDLCWTTRISSASHIVWLYALFFHNKMSFCLGYASPLLRDETAKAIAKRIQFYISRGR